MDDLQAYIGFPVIGIWGQILRLSCINRVFTTPYLCLQIDQSKFLNISVLSEYDELIDDETFSISIISGAQKLVPSWVGSPAESSIDLGSSATIRTIESVQFDSQESVLTFFVDGLKIEITPSEIFDDYLDVKISK